jgi:uncharacterized protein YbaP (TraB family)
MRALRHVAWAALIALTSVPVLADSAVWALRGERNTIYLAGSVHALPANDAALPSTIEKAYADAEALVMEIDLDDMDPAEAARFLMERGVLPADQSLRSLLSAEHYSTVVKLTTSLGFPAAGLERLEPWAVALLITQLAMTRSGFDAQLGVDQQLAQRAQRDRKPITGLETLTQQLQVFDGQSYEEQVKFLQLSSVESQAVAQELGQLIDAWRAGDLDALARELSEAFADTPNLYDALLKERNAAWVPHILQLQASTDDYLVVVGALHLAGDDSVIRMLEARGLKLERLQ